MVINLYILNFEFQKKMLTLFPGKYIINLVGRTAD